jgi:hypothetical protein
MADWKKDHQNACEALISDLQAKKGPIDADRQKVADRLEKAKAVHSQVVKEAKAEQDKMRPMLIKLDSLLASLSAAKRIKSEAVASATMAELTKQAKEL